MMRSFLLKLLMLAVTASLAIWIGWPAPPPPPIETAAPVEDGPVAPSLPKADRFKAALHGPSVTATAPPTGTRAQTPRPAKVDLNRASVEELQQLPGIGEVLARRVVDHRTQRGPYRKLEDLLEVKGIGAKRFAELQPRITVGRES